jgi:hypothetical protein
VTAPLVTIVILNWNGASDTVACLRSCAHLVDRPAPAIVVVDNASTDESVPEIRGEFPATPVIEAPSNLGYAGGNNLGIRWALEAGSEYIWLLNNDTRVGPRALTELVQALRADRGAAMAGSKILYDADPDRLWSAGGYFTRSGLARHRGFDQVDHGQFDQSGPVGYVTGCSLLVRAEVVRQIGLLLEEYFLYYEDVEWNARAHRLGWTSIYVPTSIVWHKVGASLTRKDNPRAYYYVTRNWMHFLGQSDPARLPLALARITAASALSLLRGDAGTAAARLRGVIDAARGRLGQ